MTARPIDVARCRYPHSIVWSPLPPLTWLFPFIGHTGITDKEGIIYDFAGPYTINRDNMAFGEPTRYYQLDLAKCKDLDWDVSVQRGCDLYAKRMHNILCDNCHSHVAKCLNNMAYGDTRAHSAFSVGITLFFKAKFVSPMAFVKTMLPFAIIIILICVLATQIK